jgi:putative transposase
MDVFFSDDDRRLYLRHLREQVGLHQVHILAWCLMPNHVHLVVIPECDASLARGIGEAHRRYTVAVNERFGWRGYLFQGRFYSCPLEGGRVLIAIRYTLRNPVRAFLAAQPWEYEWSSARWMVGRAPHDPLAEPSVFSDPVTDWEAFLREEPGDADELRRQTRTGRPFGSPAFTEDLEARTGRTLRCRPPGRPCKK